MNSRMVLRLSVVISIMGILAATTATAAVGRANAALFNPKEYTISAPTSGSGTAGTGSLAVSAFFDSSSSSGAGGIGGSLAAKGGNEIAMEEIFSLTMPNPASMPVLPCGPAGEVGSSGVVISGLLQGDPVTVFSCVGIGVVGGLQIVDRFDPYKNFAYNGISISSDGSTAQWPFLTAAVVAGNTVGTGSAGTGSIAIAETLVALLVNGRVQLQGGGAFVGTLNTAVPVGGTFITKTASIGNGCETDILGVVSSGLFLGRPETTSFVPATCPPTFHQQGRLLLDNGIVGFTIGTPTSTIYYGKGPGQVGVLPRIGQEVIA